MVDAMLIDLKALMVEREDCDAGTVEKLKNGLAQGKTQYRTLRDVTEVLRKKVEGATGAAAKRWHLKLGIAEFFLGHLGEALSHLKQSEGALANFYLGRALVERHDYDEALKAFEQVVAIRVRVLGENHLDVARALTNLGAVLTQLGRFDDALAAHNRALAIQRRAAADDLEIHPSLRGIGMIQMRKGDFAGALESFRAAQAVVEKRYGDNHPFLADSLYNVAHALEKLNRLEESQKLLERSLDIRKRMLPPDHPAASATFGISERTVISANPPMKAATIAAGARRNAEATFRLPS